MQGSARVIEYLNAYLAIELTGHRQYLRNSRSCANWGFDRLADMQYDYSVEEMEHAVKLADRILFLEGEPDFSASAVIESAATPIDQLQQDLALIKRARRVLGEAIAHCEQQEDFVSRGLLAAMLEDEEQHTDWLETELELVERIGLQNYLQSQQRKSV